MPGMYFEVRLQAYIIFHQNCGFMNLKMEIYNEFGLNVTKRSPFNAQRNSRGDQKDRDFFYSLVTHHAEIIFVKKICFSFYGAFLLMVIDDKKIQKNCKLNFPSDQISTHCFLATVSFKSKCEITLKLNASKK